MFDLQFCELPKALESERSLRRLLVAEKKRRGVSASDLVFVGMHNIAQFWWCGMYAVLKSRRNELGFFAAYLEDRLRCSLALARIERMPMKQADILDVGHELRYTDVESLFAETIQSESSESKRRGASKRSMTSSLVRYGEPEDIEEALAEQYPRYRWAFPWKRYVIIGVPDGLTNTIVYEFKVARNRHCFLTAARPVAATQADLYGMFFERPEKRVQILIREEGLVETINAPVDRARAVATLERFASVDGGTTPLRPKAYKCRSCEESEECPIRQV